MTEIPDVETVERLITALGENTRAAEDVQRALLTLTTLLLDRQVFFREVDHRPIEERGAPLPTIQRDDDDDRPSRRVTDE